jgi:hypothetical protein
MNRPISPYRSCRWITSSDLNSSRSPLSVLHRVCWFYTVSEAGCAVYGEAKSAERVEEDLTSTAYGTFRHEPHSTSSSCCSEIERILLTAPKKTQELPDRDRGLLIVSVTGMRTWAAGLGGSGREAFLGDLRMVEDTRLSRGDKLRVVERIWRCFGTDGRQKT